MHRMISFATVLTLLWAGNVKGEFFVSEAYHDAYAYDGYTDAEADEFTEATDASYHADLNATISDGSSRTELTRSAGGLDVILSHVRPSSFYSFSQGQGWETFSVDVPTAYAISGVYGMTGGGTISLSADLYDVTDDTYLFSNGQLSEISIAAPNCTFTLGGMAGDDSYLEGTLTGTLQPGREYQFSYKAFILNSPEDSGPANGSGRVTLALTAVPEPSTMASCIALSLFSGVWIARRRLGRK